MKSIVYLLLVTNKKYQLEWNLLLNIRVSRIGMHINRNNIEMKNLPEFCTESYITV